MIKFMYSEKATIFCEISNVYLTVTKAVSWQLRKRIKKPVQLENFLVLLILTQLYIGLIYGGDRAKVCGLLRIYELYQHLF